MEQSEQDARESYRAQMVSRVNNAEGKVLPYPGVSHERLTKRALARQKPFSESGAGYRDALIWESVVDLARGSDAQIFLITRNKRDFADEKGQLHSDLARSFTEAGIDVGRIELVDGLQPFVEKFGKPALEQLQQEVAEIAAGTYLGVDLGELIGIRAVELLGGEELNPADVGFPSEYESPTISLLQDVRIDAVKEVLKLNSGEVLVELTVSAYIEFDFFIYKSNWWAMDEEEEPYISDPDWNERYMAASKSKQVEMDLTLTLDPGSKTITSMELDRIGGEY